jgi:hypothetical protein
MREEVRAAACQFGSAWGFEYRIGTKSTNERAPGVAWRFGRGPLPASGPASLTALAAQRSSRRAETGYAASAFFEEDDGFSDFFDESDDEDESLFESFFDSLFSPPSLPLRSISRLRRLVP